MGYSKHPRLLSTVIGIDAKTVGTTTLFTVPTNFTVVVTSLVLTTLNATTVTQRPVMGLGIAAGEDDIFASRALTGFTSGDSVYTFTAGATSRDADAGDVIKLGIDNGSTATAHTLRADLFGYIIAV